MDNEHAVYMSMTDSELCKLNCTMCIAYATKWYGTEVEETQRTINPKQTQIENSK